MRFLCRVNQVCKANTWSWFNGLLDVEEKLLFTSGFFWVDFQMGFAHLWCLSSSWHHWRCMHVYAFCTFRLGDFRKKPIFIGFAWEWKHFFAGFISDTCLETHLFSGFFVETWVKTYQHILHCYCCISFCQGSNEHTVDHHWHWRSTTKTKSQTFYNTNICNDQSTS